MKKVSFAFWRFPGKAVRLSIRFPIFSVKLIFQTDEQIQGYGRSDPRSEKADDESDEENYRHVHNWFSNYEVIQRRIVV